MEMEELEKKAIRATLSSNWLEAIELNKQILKDNPSNIEALNRLGFIYLKLGKVREAKRKFKKVLKINRFNIIASKNLERLKRLKKIKPKKAIALSPSLFLEEPGKTKTVSLVKLPPQKVLDELVIGQPCLLQLKRHRVEVRTMDKVYLGAIPDDLSFCLIRLIEAGYQYQALIKNVKENFLSIFLREIKRGKKLKGQPSFPSQEKHSPYEEELS